MVPRVRMSHALRFEIDIDTTVNGVNVRRRVKSTNRCRELRGPAVFAQTGPL
jgi:hypothetical protein